MSNPTYCSAVC